ncbi:MAG: PGPGW domain-containing protein [Desulfarculaceae bacterium]|nr:PGPGW domain-containing protein [Desulfarculaceae bacterium]
MIPENMILWITDNTVLLALVSGISFVFLAAGLISLPIIIGRLPCDFFMAERKPWFRYLPKGLYILVFTAKNVLGFFLLVLGIVMLFTPGQGLLTILVGFGAMNFPGKQRMIDRMLSLRRLRRVLNWIRAKRGANEFSFPFPEERGEKRS